MEISEKSIRGFIEKIGRKRICNEDLMFVVEELSYLASDNDFDREGFFDELIENLSTLN